MQGLNTTASVFAEGLDHAEGIATHPDGSVWCGGEAGQIYRIDPTGKRTEQIASNGGFVLGIAFSPDCGWLAICDNGRKAVLRMDLKSLEITELPTTINGWQVRIPNYPVFDRTGRLYVSDSGAFGECLGRILRYAPSGEAECWAGGDLAFANGLAFDPGSRNLYVVESFLPGVSRFPILADGWAGSKEIISDQLREVPDGIAFDARGNLYWSCYAPSRIYKIAPGHQPEILIEDPTCHLLSNCTNIAFGGPDFDVLFAANIGRWHITKIELATPGMPLACHKQP
jgi:sugar lactone lactonase YvrE